MKQQSFSWPVTENWLFTHLDAAGYRPRTRPKDKGVDRKTKDIKSPSIRYTIKLPNMHQNVTRDDILRAIKECQKFCQVKCDVRKNTKWIGVTVTLTVNASTASGK